MVKLITRLSLFVAIMLYGVSAFGQVTIGSTTYSNLYSAFTAINAGTHTGNITVQITSNITESSVPTLQGSGVGNASYSSITIYPTGTYTVQINNTSGLIWLQGASNVTIDGRTNMSGSSQNLTFKNNSTGGPVVRIDSSTTYSKPSSNNKIMYCNLIGSAKNNSNCIGVSFGTSASLTGTASSSGNEVAYNVFKFLYMGVRLNGASTSQAPKNTKIYGNYFGSSTLTESISYQAIFCNYTSNTQIYSNTFEYLDYTSSMYVMYLYYSDAVKVYNNTVKNIMGVSSLYGFYIYYCGASEVYGNTFDNVKTSSGLLYPIYIYNSTQAAVKIYNNTLNNLSCTSTFYGIYMYYGNYSQIYNNTMKNISATTTMYATYLSSCPYVDFYNNTFENFTNSGTSTNYGLFASSCNNSNFNDNKFRNLQNGAYFYTMYISSCADSKFQRNLIDGIYSNGSSVTAAIGFYVLSSNNCIFVNNSVSRLLTTRYSTGSTTNPVGFLLSSGTGYKLYYNSINLTGTQFNVGTSLSQPTCLWVSSTSVNAMDIRNNNFYNDVVAQSGSRSYAVYLSGSGNMTSTTMDYNNYYVAGANSAVGYYNAVRTTIADWKSGTGKETNSISVDPVFNAPDVLAPYIGSPVLGKGTPISGYTTDYLGLNRSGTTPTPGAYEEADDIVGPTILFTKLLTTTSTTSRTVVANITDKTGINLTSSVPKLYYRKQSTSNTYNDNTSSTAGWKFSVGMQAGNDFTFTVDYSKIQGGIAINDVIEYFIIAQDVASKQNITITSGTFSSYPTSTNLTSANFPVNNADNYRIAAAITGNYNVGTSQTYTNLTGPSGFFNFLNQNVVTGDVNILVTSNLAETGDVQLGRLVYEGGPFTVTVRPSSTTKRTISGEVAGTLIRIIGTNNFTIDGSYNNDGGRYLAINNTATNTTTTYRATIMVGSGGGPVYGGQNITIQNCEIYSGSRLNYSFGIITSDAAITTSSSTFGMSNLVIRNNWIYNVTYGIYAAGGTGTGQMMNNLLIEKNVVGHDTKSSSILSYGIEVRYAPSGLVRYNKIYNFDGGPNNTNYCIGIQLYGTGSIGSIIDGNTITGLNYQGTSVCFVNGIYVVNGAYHIIRNNMISEILTTAYINYYTSSYAAAGIRIQTSNTYVWHNTIFMTGAMKLYSASTDYGGVASNITVTSTYSGNDFRGNILHNSVSNASGSIAPVQAYNILFYASSSISPYFSNLDRNLYSVGNGAKVAGYTPDAAAYYFMAYDLSTWKAHTGRDINSYQIQPSIVSTTLGSSDAHINGSSIGNSSFMYAGMPEITTDGDGEMRNNPTYYGADEVNPVFNLVTDTKVAPSTPTQCVNDVVTVSFDPQVTGFGDGVSRSGLQAIDINWYKNGSLISGQKGKSITYNPVKMTDSANYYATATFMGKTLTSTQTLMKVETPIGFTLQPLNNDVCTTSPNLYLYTNPTGSIFGYQWEFRKAGTSNWVDIQGAINKDLYKLMESSATSVGDYRLRVMGPGNCGPAVLYSNISNVTLSEPLTEIFIKQYGNSEGKDLTHTCVGENIKLQMGVKGTVFGYRWQRNVGQGFVDLSAAQYPTAHTTILELNNSDPNESGIYRCKILGSASCGDAEEFTDPIPVRIWPYFSLDQQPESKTLCIGDDSFIRVNVTGVVYSYLWFKDGKALTALDNENYNKPVLYINDAKFDHDGVYACQVSAEDCFGYVGFMSEPASIYVATGTEITNAPFTQSVMPGENVTFRVRAHVNGAPEGVKPTVQWYRGSKMLEEGVKFVGTKSDILSIANVSDADFGEDYRVVVTGHCGFDEAKGFGLTKGSITILEQPQGVDACQDENIILSVRANTNIPNMDLTYQWFRNGNKLVDGNGITGANAEDLHIYPANKSLSGSYYCLIKPSNSVTGLTTVDAVVSIENKAEITSQPNADVKLKPAETLALTVDAIGNDLTYQWFFNGQAITDAEENTLMIYDVKEENTGKYYVEITNSCGTVRSVESNVVVTTTTTDVKDLAVNGGFALSIPSPNPARTTSTVSYVLPTASKVHIALVNELGNEVAVLTNGIYAEGTHNLTINAETLNLTSGVYSIVLKSTNVILSQRMIVIK